MEILSGIGFQDVELRARFDPFRATTKEPVARKFGVIGVNVYARKSN